MRCVCGRAYPRLFPIDLVHPHTPKRTRRPSTRAGSVQCNQKRAGICSQHRETEVSSDEARSELGVGCVWLSSAQSASHSHERQCNMPRTSSGTTGEMIAGWF
ncbi:hypothetical protein Pcac1_g6826 [Phytophthora cactorum]|nr:hypothetical protein Pcac1_g6826 [Phytophthora cactorum]